MKNPQGESDSVTGFIEERDVTISEHTARLEDFIGQARIIEAVGDPRNRIIMVIGDVDTGKTTLIECLSRFLAGRTKLGIVDSDIGQSHIGAPTTVAWGRMESGTADWSSIKMHDFYFTGSLSPTGNLVPTIVGAKLMTEKALSICQKVVVDTTGFIAEPVGRILKQFKIDLLSPDIVLALERTKELKHILDPFTSQESPVIYRIRVPSGVGVKTVTERTRYREHKFSSYFAGARTFWVSMKEVAVRFAQTPLQFRNEDLRNRIVSFRDAHNTDIDLGKVEEVDTRSRKLLVASPIGRDRRFSTLIIGTTRLTLSPMN